MGTFKKVFLLSTIMFVVFVGVKINNLLLGVPPLPKLHNTWWGPGKPTKEDTSVKIFKINISHEVLQDLQQRLNNARPLTPPLEDARQHYGMNTDLLKQIVEFWKTKYDWKERETFLNQFPQFTTQIQGLKIHFLHVKPTVKPPIRVLPIVLLHGWPGSVRMFYEIIPLLTSPQKNRDFVFEVIAPSLPGYGFSEGASRAGLGLTQMAVIFKNLMERLGHHKYYLQGGDWGAFIAKHMAILYPEKVLGLHSNLCFSTRMVSLLKLFVGSFYPPLIIDEEHKHLVYPLSNMYSTLLLELGYLNLQATKPDTFGVALNDSPIGLAGYILEKITTGTNKQWKNLPDGGLTKKFTYTELLDNVMIYWITKTATTSSRLYAETFNKTQIAFDLDKIPVTVPTACAKFTNEIGHQPDSILKDAFPNLLHSSVNEGGHFASMEEPEILAKDIFTAVEKIQLFNSAN